MGNQPGKSVEFGIAKKKFSGAEYDTLEQAFSSMAHQSKSGGSFVVENVFIAYYKLAISIGELVFRFLENPKDPGRMRFDEFVQFMARYIKSSPGEIDECIFKIISEGGEAITRERLKSVVQSVIDSSAAEEQEKYGCFAESMLNSACFEESKPSAEQVISSPNFQKWLELVPSVRRNLRNLFSEPSVASAGRSPPNLVTPNPKGLQNLLLKPEQAWHLLGAMKEKDSKQWGLVFNSSSDGLSFNTFVGKSGLVKSATILVVRDKSGSVFGGYASQPWERHSDFYGDMKSFLFSLLPVAAIYRPSGANSKIQWCGVNFTSESIPNGVGFGGQVGHFGLFLESSFERGHSRSSVTFNNPSLSSSPVFEIETVELWAVLEPNGGGEGGGGSAGLQGTILERFKEERAVLNLVGIANASDSSVS